MNQTPVCAKQPSRVLSAVQLFALVFISSLQGRELWLRRVEHLTMTTKAKLFFFSLWLAVSTPPSLQLENINYCLLKTHNKTTFCILPSMGDHTQKFHLCCPGTTKHYILFQHQPVSYRHSCMESHLEAEQLNSSHSTPDSLVERFSSTCLPLSFSFVHWPIWRESTLSFGEQGTQM